MQYTYLEHEMDLILNKSLSGSIWNFGTMSDRVMLLQLAIRPVNVYVYVLTADHDDGEVEAFYKQIKDIMKVTKKYGITLFMGDWNAKVGKEKTDDVTGQYGFGVRNDKGKRIVQFSQEEEFVITNTWYSLPHRRLYPWTSPQHTQKKIVRNEIVFILINRRFRKCKK